MDRRSARRYRDTERLAGLLDRQHGVVATWQVAECGYSKWAVSRSVAVMEFRWVHRGVLTVAGRQLTFRGLCMAAALACGPDAVLSHHAAAALHDLRPVPQAAIDVSVPGKRRHKGIRCHVSPVPADQRATVDRIPVTSLERTFLDYAEQATPRQLRNALAEAERRTILDLRAVRLVIDHNRGRRGLKPLTRAMAELTDDPQWTQSPLEELFLELIRASGLPLPRANVLIHGELVDFAWPQHQVIVEVDGFAFHSGHEAFENDRRRDTKLQKLGWRVLRVTDRRLRADPAGVIADVRAILNQ